MITRWPFKIIARYIEVLKRPEWKATLITKEETVGGFKKSLNILGDSMLMEQIISYPDGNEIRVTSIIADVKIISKQNG